MSRAVLLLTLFAGTAPASAAGPFVVVVGVGAYADEAIAPRPTAEADAQALHACLTDPRYLGIPTARARLLVGDAATRPAIVQAVTEAFAQTGKDDLVVLAFFGRGTSAGDETAFFLPDTVVKDRATTALVFGTDLGPAFQKLSRQRLLFLADIQFRGFQAGDAKIADPTFADVDRLLFGQTLLDARSKPPDRLFLLANYITYPALTVADCGLFVTSLLDALTGAADAPPHHDGYEPDGLVTTDELVRYVLKVMPEQARQLGTTPLEKAIVPVAIGATGCHFPLTQTPAGKAARARLDAFTALVRARNLADEVAREGAALLQRMPKLAADQELRKRYQSLADGKLARDEFLTARAAHVASRKLAPEVASKFAAEVTEAAELVERLYIRKVELGDLTAAALRGLYNTCVEPLPDDLDAALLQPNKLTEEQRLSLLRDARLRLGKRADLEGTRAVDHAIAWMVGSLQEKYTVYYDRPETRRMAPALRGRYPGVGLQITRYGGRDELVVVTPQRGSPAFLAGIRAQDRIVEIRRDLDDEGQPLPAGSLRTRSTKGMTAEEGTALLSGKPGMPITVVVQRGQEPETRTYALKTAWVSLETVFGVQRKPDGEWDHLLDPQQQIGYVRISQMTQTSGSDLAHVVAALKRTGLRGLILDFRDNPGGYQSTAVHLAQQFVGKETVVTIRPRPGSAMGRTRSAVGEQDGDLTLPLVLLINGQTASSCEMVAGCLQDHGRAVIVGERTYGKGSIQDVLPFPMTGGEIKLTVARYCTPQGRNIDRDATRGRPEEEWGVRPDQGFEVILTEAERNYLNAVRSSQTIIRAPGAPTHRLDEARDRQLQAALVHLRKVIAERK